MSLLPIFLNLEGRRCLLVGAGTVALDKIGSLLKTGVRLRVVAPRAKEEVRQLAREGKLEWIERAFDAGDLDGNYIVIAATDSPAVNTAVYEAAVERGIPCNSVDDIPNCDFFFGSVVSRGDLQIAISTAGESPAMAQRLRREIDAQLPEDLGPWLRNLGALRREVLSIHPRGEERKAAAAPTGAASGLRFRGVPVAAPRPRASGQDSSRAGRQGVAGGRGTGRS